MPWETSFDVDDVLDRATKVFWAKGYEATSLGDLIKATGINKGSIYNTFGSKKELFTRALLKYDREQRAQTLSSLTALNDPHLAIETLFDALIAQSVEDDERKGCLLINTALDLPNHDEDIEKTVKNGLQDFQQFFEQQIALGKEQGSIDKQLDLETTAAGLLTLVVGLRVLARGVFDETGLAAIKSQAIDLL